MNLPKTLWRAGLVVVTAAVLSVPVAKSAMAKDLTIGLRAPPASTDPHWMTSPAQFQVNTMIFDPLLKRGDDSQPKPWLATSWEMKDNTTWIFHLRKDVKWHDGKPFTAEDVKFTYSRAGNVPKAPNSFRTYLNQIKETIVVDPYTIKIVTKEPAPSLLDKLVYVLIVSKHVGDGASTQDYNDGKAMVGTGPYKFVSWSPQSTTILARNDNFWGGKQPWEKVTYKIMTNDATRLAALLAGDIDLMETVPALEIDKLKKNPDISISGVATGKIAYYSIDTTTALTSGRVTGPNGEKLTKNPFENADVREAMDIAIDRAALVDRYFKDQAIATDQYVPAGKEGHNPSMKVQKANLERAADLMKKSGWAGKFKIEVLTAPTFHENVVKVSEAIAQFWTQIGIKTTVAAMPYGLLSKTRKDGKAPVVVASYQNSTGTAENLFPTLIHTPDRKRGFGVLNRYGYSNKKVDALVEQAHSMMDDKKRSDIYAEAAQITRADRRMVPLYFLVATHASRKGIRLIPRMDFQILPTNAVPVEGTTTSQSKK